MAGLAAPFTASATDSLRPSAIGCVNFFFGNGADRAGMRVASRNLDGDARADLIVGSGEGIPPAIRVYHGKAFVPTAVPSTFQVVEPLGISVAGGIFVG
jgi:hypothetical protein